MHSRLSLRGLSLLNNKVIMLAHFIKIPPMVVWIMCEEEEEKLKGS